VSNPHPEQGVGQEPNAVELDEHGGVSDVAKHQ
jgi:hypothetical protein